MREKLIMDKLSIARALKRMAHEILERTPEVNNLVIVGIRRRGDYLAKRLAKLIFESEGLKPCLGFLDVTLYRDDLMTRQEQPVVRTSEIPVDITGWDVLLVDDVLFAGRTARAALDALMDFGRPKSVRLAVLIDRGHRELPIKADYIGKTITTTLHESVKVELEEIDSEEKVVIVEKR
jgi:pyrimidine operon attenuation protein/uracil phosphoribosyltransferase